MNSSKEILSDAAAAEREILQFVNVGKCVNAVSHDVNNCLGAILAYAELCSLDPALGSDSRRMVGRIIEAVERANTLVIELTNVARPLTGAAGVLDLRQLIRGVLLLRDYDLRIRQVKVVQILPEQVPSVAGDAALIRLALLYLFLHCERALRSSDHPEIQIRMSVEPGGLLTTFTLSCPLEGLEMPPEIADARRSIEHHGGNLEFSSSGFSFYLPYQLK